MKLISLIVIAWGLVTWVDHARAATMYAASASGGPGNLFVIDPASGAVMRNVGPLNDADGVNYPITGLAFHPTTKVLYGSTGNNPAETASRLVTIDPATALVTVIGNFNPGNPGTRDATMADIAFDPTGNLFGVGTVGGPQLYSIDIATAQATLIGSSGLTSTTGGGLAIAADGTFYGTPTASRYGTYDAATGAFTEIANPITRPGGGGAYAALAISPSGMLYGMNSAPGSPPPTYLALIDPATGEVTSMGQSVNALDAIAFIPEPTSLALLLGATLLAFSSRRR